MLFRKTLLIYTSEQSPKGECPPLPMPKLTQNEGMQSNVWPTKFGFFLLALSLYWDAYWQIVTAELRLVCRDSRTWAVISRSCSAYTDFASIQNQNWNTSSLGVRCWERIKFSSNAKNYCFITTTGKIILFVPAGDLVHTVRKPELCLDILIT